MTFKLSTPPVPLTRRDHGTKWKVLSSSQGALGFTIIYYEMAMEDEPEGGGQKDLLSLACGLMSAAEVPR